MSQMEGTRGKGLPKRGAVKAQIFSNIYQGIRSSLSRSNSYATESADGQCVACVGETGTSGPLDTSMMVKEA